MCCRGAHTFGASHCSLIAAVHTSLSLPKSLSRAVLGSFPSLFLGYVNAEISTTPGRKLPCTHAFLFFRPGGSHNYSIEKMHTLIGFSTLRPSQTRSKKHKDFSPKFAIYFIKKRSAREARNALQPSHTRSKKYTRLLRSELEPNHARFEHYTAISL